MFRHGKVIVAATLACALGFGAAPCIAFAEEAPAAPANLDEAWATYGDLSMKVAEIGESLNDTYYQLQQSEAAKASLGDQIVESTARLDRAKVALGERVSANYKSGLGSLLDIILGSDSFESLVAALHYVDKMTEADVAAVNEVKDASNQLEAQKADLEKTERELKDLAAQKEDQLAGLKDSLAKQEGYIASLSEPLRAAFDEKQVSEIVAMQAKAVQALADQEAALAASGNGSSAVPSGADVANAVSAIAQETSAPASTDSASASAPTSSSSLTSEARAKILEAAYSQLGVNYVYGASSPGEAFDCSGLTSWAYEQAGIEIPHSSVAQAGMATNKSVDELEPGDLVFWVGNVEASQSGSHVAIYAGDGEIIHANGSVVTTSTLNDNWTSAGSIGID